MFSYLLYNSILLSSLVFGYLAEYANFKQFRFLARFIVFIGLFLPAALRYDVGYDYWSYSAIYTGIMDAGSAVEPGFLFLQEAGRSLNLDTQWIFVLSSFVMYFPIAFLIGTKSFFLIVTFYTLYLYLEVAFFCPSIFGCYIFDCWIISLSILVWKEKISGLLFFIVTLSLIFYFLFADAFHPKLENKEFRRNLDNRYSRLYYVCETCLGRTCLYCCWFDITPICRIR